jgi:4-methyl-5(b-hydroxyethyl)-thiazole monophosphate biosynthesis
MKTVLVLLCKGVESYEFGAIYDVLGWSGAHGSEKVEVVTAGLKSPVVGTFGWRILPDKLVNEVNADRFDALAIPGGFESYGFYEDAFAEPVTDLIRQFEAKQKPIAAICVAALSLGKAGILNGRPATTYHALGSRRREQLADFGAVVQDRSIVTDRNVITCTAPGPAVEVALWLLARLTGEENANHVGRLMGFEVQD